MVYKEQIGQQYWSPVDADEELEGSVVDVVEGDYGKQYTILKGDGTTLITPSHAYLQNRMKHAKLGAKVKIVYKGEEPPSVKGRNPTKIYKVFIDE